MPEAANKLTSTSLAGGHPEMGSVGKSTGPRIAIMDREGELADGGIKGEVVLSGASLIRRYASPPEANDTAFQRDWFRTGDEGYLDDGVNLRLKARCKNMTDTE